MRKISTVTTMPVVEKIKYEGDLFVEFSSHRDVLFHGILALPFLKAQTLYLDGSNTSLSHKWWGCSVAHRLNCQFVDSTGNESKHMPYFFR